MAIQTTTQLKKWFGTGCYPTGAQFADLIDSLRHKSEHIELSEVEGLCTALNGRANREEMVALQRAFEGLQSGVKTLGYAVKDGGSAIIRFSGFVDGELGHPCTGRFTEEQVGDLLYHRTWQRFIEVVAADDWEYAEVADPVPGFFYVNEDALYIGVAGEERNGLVEMTALLALAADVRDNVARSRVITLTRVADLRYSWSGAALGDIRQGDILTWTDTDEMFRAVVFGERTSGTRREVCAMFTRDGDEAIEFSLLWFHENGEAYETVFDSSQTLAVQLAACQNKLTDTADIQVRAEARPSGQLYTPYGLYLKDSAKRAVFNDMFDLAAGSDGGYKPSEAPDPAKPYLLNTLWLSYEEAVKIYAINGADARHPLPDIGRRFSRYYGADYMTGVRTLFKVVGKTSMHGMFFSCSDLETLNLEITGGHLSWLFRGNSKLKTVTGTINLEETQGGYAVIFGAPLLENVNFKNLKSSVIFIDCPKLSLATMQYLVDNASKAITAEKPVVVTVDADVFAKLTGDMTNEAAAALTDDEKAAWAAVLTAATAKYISFATD